MEILTNTLLLFSIAFIVLYLLGWVSVLVLFLRMGPVRRHSTKFEVSGAGMIAFILSVCYSGMLGFIFSVCYNVAYWMM